MSSAAVQRQYATRTLVEAGWPLGFVRDSPRHAIPPGGSYDLLDYLLDLPGVLRKRGGTSFQSEALAGQTDIIGIAAPEFPGDPRVVAFASDGANTTLYDITETTAGAPIDANGAQPIENPSFYWDRLILCDGAQSGTDPYTPQKVYLDTGSVVIADLEGAPPLARYSCAHLDRIVLANGVIDSAEHQNRVWFGPSPGDLTTTWDTEFSYIDFPEPVTGLVTLQGVLMVFTRSGYQRILGDVPPGYGTAKQDVTMQEQPSTQTGCLDARSLVKDEAWVYVANERGVFRCNAAGDQSMTTKDDGSGIAAFWSAQVAQFTPGIGIVIASGIYLDHLVVTITRIGDDAPSSQRTTIACYLPTGAWTRLSGGCGGTMYATRFAPSYEMYFGLNNPFDASANQARAISSIFTPAAANKQDADGTDIEPLWESRTLGLDVGVGMKHYDLAHLTYRLLDAGGDDPTFTVTESEGLEADGAFDAVPESPFPETSA